MFTPIASSRPFRRLLVSWNVDCPPGAGFDVHVRVERAGVWSPWLFLDAWGVSLPSTGTEGERRVDFEGGRIAVDEFIGTDDFDRAQLRFRSDGAPAPRRVTFCFTADEKPTSRTAHASVRNRRRAPTALSVPSYSQREESPELAARICSPTSLAMVLSFHGAEVRPAEVARRAYDPRHDIYGNWPRSIQAAWSFGIAGCLARYDTWLPVDALVAAGRPVIVSIRVSEGGLTGAPYASTPGHLLVVVGFDASGDVIVHDPAADTANEVRRTYSRAELGRAWFGHGGTAYVLDPAPTTP